MRIMEISATKHAFRTVE